MIVFVAFPVMLLIAGPLATLVCMAAYFKEKVIVYIMLIIALNASVHKHWRSIPYSAYASHEFQYSTRDREKAIKEDTEALLNTAIFTSWISPSSQGYSRSKFQHLSSIINLIGYITGIATIIIFISLAELPLSDNPPITHCLKNENNISLKFILNLFSCS